MDQQLERGLLPRHVRMMAIGGAIGAGIFKGSADTISLAGPGVIFAYLFAGLLLFIVMSGLAEMAGVYPRADLRDLIKKAFGFRISFVTGWLYWINWVVVMAVEIVAAGSLLQYWFPQLPVWLLSLFVAGVLLILNLASVRLFGEFEFWLSGIKVTTLILFIVLGFSLLFGVVSDDAPYFEHYTSHGGFFPLGLAGVFSSLLIVIFSYGGTEMIGLTIRETKDAQHVMPKIVRGVIVRVCLFYVLPLLVICGLMPWNEIGAHGSPFVQVLSGIGLKGAAHIMNFVMLTALVSAANSGMYATSRMLYSMAEAGEAPSLFSRLSGNGVPFFSLLMSSVFLFLGALVAYLTPEHVFQYLMGIPGFTVLMMWITICLAQLKLRKKYPVSPVYQSPYYPYATIFTTVSLVVILFAMLFDAKNLISSSVAVGVVVVLFLLSWLQPKKDEENAKADAA
ncbi:amino acid permease [Lihuaxuella thermophila]|uniref:Amino acid transporter, AAT family n=1 Tax=Lihuaxuella thermophila TaxID=1173111 RepID=A0A1H8ECB5_9BACL|nr:amino acid transporter, AAT family [Lihuaxuella thermophila]